MSEEKKDLILDLVNEVLAVNKVFITLNIMNINHKPHQFMIGPKHIIYASDNYKGILGNETLKVVPCAYPKCNMMYHEHTSNKAIFLQLQKNTTNQEASNEMVGIKEILEANKIDGVVLVDTKEKFKVSK